ncbi:alpha/beta-hydrolase [Auricularia subglabra TFB-10046 SS5]|nr:alpha/beta-hydrolase [Auricularia subglabra TFB-10046 SS5]
MPGTTSPKQAATSTLSECCVSGHLHSGRPTGLSTRLAGLDVYEALPPNKSKARAVLFITDIFGWTLPNARLLADELATQGGLFVVVPDFFQGDPIPHDMLNTIVPRKPDDVSALDKAKNTALATAAFAPWLTRHREAVARPLIDNVVKALRDDPEVKSIGAIGFCWGGRYAMLLAADGTVDAIVANHPSLVSLPSEVEAIKKPVQINIGDKDAMVDDAGIKTFRDVLSKKSDVLSEVNVFPGAVHGFTVRGDLEEPLEREQKEKATQNAIRWFQQHLQ